MSEGITVVTNNVPRDVIGAYELTAEERAEFDYLDWSAMERGEDSASFFRYRGRLYDLGEFEWTGALGYPEWVKAWDGIQSDSFFSGMVVRYVENFERVIVARYYS